MQQSAVDGNQAVVNNVALRNVRILALQTGDFLRPGATVDLVLVAVNQSPDITDKLLGITTDIGKVTVTGDPTLPASGVLFIGPRSGQHQKAADAVESANSVKATVALAKPITNGPNYNFTFTFEKAGSVSVAVPISAPEEPAAERTAGTGLTSPDLSDQPDTVTGWPRHVRSTAARNAAMSPPNGWDAAWSAAPGARSTKWRCSALSEAAIAPRLARRRLPFRSVPSSPTAPATAHRHR